MLDFAAKSTGDDPLRAAGPPVWSGERMHRAMVPMADVSANLADLGKPREPTFTPAPVMVCYYRIISRSSNLPLRRSVYRQREGSHRTPCHVPTQLSVPQCIISYPVQKGAFMNLGLRLSERYKEGTPFYDADWVNDVDPEVVVQVSPPV